MVLTIIKEYDAVNRYNKMAYRTIYNNNVNGNNFMIADFNTRYYPGSIIAITPSFKTILELIRYYEITFQNYNQSIRFINNYIVERY